MVGDVLVVVSGVRETTVPKLIANCFAEVTIRTDVDICGKLSNSEKQVQ